MNTFHKKHFEYNGDAINYLKLGKGEKSIIFLHGLCSDSTLWKKVIPYLKYYNNHKMYSLNLPHYASKSQNGITYRFEEMTELLRNFITSKKISKPILIGQSLGGLISILYSSKYPNEVKKIIAVSTPVRDHSEKPPVLWSTAIDFIMKSDKAQDIIEYIINSKKLSNIAISLIVKGNDKYKNYFKRGGISNTLNKIPLKSIVSCYHDVLNHNFAKHLKNISKPTLFVYGTEDTLLLDIKGASQYDKVKNCLVFSIPTSHYIPTTNPGDLAFLISRFLEE